MGKDEKVANILCFLVIMFGESSVWYDEIMNFNPDYIIEKFERYILSIRDEWQWGIHPSLRNGPLNRYIEKWKLQLDEDK